MKHHILTIKELYPLLTDDELKRAEENLSRYLKSTLDLYDRITSDPEAYARFQVLTASMKNSYDDGGQKVEFLDN